MTSTDKTGTRKSSSLKLPPSPDFPGPDGPDPSKMPERLYQTDCYPPECKINSYSKPELLLDLVQALEGTSELEYLEDKCFKSLLKIPVRLASFTGKLVHQMLCRSLHTKKKYELWFVFAGQSIRFFIREFTLITRLDCRDYPPEDEVLAMQTVPEGKSSVADMLFGKDNPIPDIKDIVSMLKRDRRLPEKEKMSKAVRLRLALLVIVDGVLCCSSSVLRPTKETVEMLRNLETFEAYPWGRKSFELTMDLVKAVTKIKNKADLLKKLGQSKWATHGFTLAIQLFILKSIPELEEPLYDIPDSVTFTDKSIDRLQYLRTYHNETILKIENNFERKMAPYLQVGDVIDIRVQDFTDEVEDCRVNYLDKLIGSGFTFTKEVWKGGHGGCPQIKVKTKGRKRDGRTCASGGSGLKVEKPIEIEESAEEKDPDHEGKGKNVDVPEENKFQLLSEKDFDKIVAMLEVKVVEKVNSSVGKRFSKNDVKEILAIVEGKYDSYLDKLLKAFNLEKAIMKDELVDEVLRKLKYDDKYPTSVHVPTDVPRPADIPQPVVNDGGDEPDDKVDAGIQSPGGSDGHGLPNMESMRPEESMRPDDEPLTENKAVNVVHKDLSSMEGSSAPDMFDTGEWQRNYRGIGSVLRELNLERGGWKYDDVLNENTIRTEDLEEDFVVCGQKSQVIMEGGHSGHHAEYALQSEGENEQEDNRETSDTEASKDIVDGLGEAVVADFTLVDEPTVLGCSEGEQDNGAATKDDTPKELSSDSDEDEERKGDVISVKIEEKVEESEEMDAEEKKDGEDCHDLVEDNMNVDKDLLCLSALSTPAKKSTTRLVESSSKVSEVAGTCNLDTASTTPIRKIGEMHGSGSREAASEFDLPEQLEREVDNEKRVTTTPGANPTAAGKHGREGDDDFEDPVPRKRLRTLPLRYGSTEPSKGPETVVEGIRKKFVSKIRQGRNKEYNINDLVETTAFFTTLYTPTNMFDYKHVEAALAMISSRNEAGLKSLRASILDSWFTRKLSSDYDQFDKLKKKFSWNNTLKNYVRGLVTGRHTRSAWFDDVDILYCPMDLGKGKWVGVVVDLKSSSLTVLDPRQYKVNDVDIVKKMAPVAQMLPFLILAAGKNLSQSMDPFTTTRPPNVPQFKRKADVGPVTVKFIELESQGKTMASVEEGGVDSMCLQIAIDIFEEFVEPVDS